MALQIKSRKAYTAPKGEETEILTDEIAYDKLGNEILHLQYDESGELAAKFTAVYNEQSQLVELCNYMDDETVSDTTQISYDDQGNRIMETSQYADESKAVKTYLRKGNAEEITTLDEEGEQDEREYIVYDDQKRPIEHTRYNYENKQIERFEIAYREDGKISLRKEYDEGNRLHSEVKLTYDENGNVLQQLTLNRKGERMNVVQFLFDEKNRVTQQKVGSNYVIKTVYDDENKTRTEERYRADGLLEVKTIYHFNEQNLVATVEDNFSTTRYEYEFFEAAE